MISTIVTAIRSLLDSEDELEMITAMTVLSMAANSGEPINFTSCYILISV
jgi:hypothetical protein